MSTSTEKTYQDGIIEGFDDGEVHCLQELYARTVSDDERKALVMLTSRAGYSPEYIYKGMTGFVK